MWSLRARAARHHMHLQQGSPHTQDPDVAPRTVTHGPHCTCATAPAPRFEALASACAARTRAVPFPAKGSVFLVNVPVNGLCERGRTTLNHTTPRLTRVFKHYCESSQSSREHLRFKILWPCQNVPKLASARSHSCDHWSHVCDRFRDPSRSVSTAPLQPSSTAAHERIGCATRIAAATGRASLESTHAANLSTRASAVLVLWQRPLGRQKLRVEAHLGLDQRRQSKIGDGSAVGKVLPSSTAVANF
jgi:hypothetical protein